MNDSRPGFWSRLFTPVQVEAPVPEVRTETPAVPPRGSSVIAPPVYAPTGVSISEAMSLATVYRAADLISGHVSQLPIGVWRKVDGQRIEVEPTPLLRQPDPNISMGEFLEMTTLSLVYQGNAYWRVYRKNDADPVSPVMRLEVLNPLMVTIEVDSFGRKTGYNFDAKPLKLHQVEHINRFPVLGTPYGLGPIQAAQGLLRGAIDLQTYSDHWFKTGQVPNGILSTDQQLNPDDADALRERWMQIQREYGRGVAVLGLGTSYQPIYLNPEQAQFLSSQQFTKTQIATLFGVPAYKLNAAVEGSNLTYQNIQDANIDYINDTLMKYVNKIEAAFTRVTPRGQEIKFKTEGLLRSDYKTQVETVTSAVAAKVMTTREAREMLGLSPLNEEELPQGNDTEAA